MCTICVEPSSLGERRWKKIGTYAPSERERCNHSGVAELGKLHPLASNLNMPKNVSWQPFRTDNTVKERKLLSPPYRCSFICILSFSVGLLQNMTLPWLSVADTVSGSLPLTADFAIHPILSLLSSQ